MFTSYNLTDKFKFCELIISQIKPIINIHGLLHFGGSKPRPTKARMASRASGCPPDATFGHLAKPANYENWQI